MKNCMKCKNGRTASINWYVVGFLLAISFGGHLGCERAEQGDPASQVLAKPESAVSGESHEDLELAVLMARMQMHMDKLYFSMNAKNSQLTKFYIHELEESLEEIQKANLKEDGVEINPIIKTTVVPVLEEFEKSVMSGADGNIVSAGYQKLVNACNTCHQATAHGFIRIRVPTRPALTNQIFDPLPLSGDAQVQQ